MGSLKRFFFVIASGFAITLGCGRSDFQSFDDLAPLAGEGGTDGGTGARGGTSSGGTNRGGTSFGGTSPGGTSAGGFGGTTSGASGTSFTGGVSGTGACSGRGLASCAGECIDLLNNPSHCGSCFAECDTDAFCVEGRCQDPCPNATLCFGFCTDTTSDPRNCGGCGNVCRGNQFCSNGFCTTTGCPPSQINCNGVCVNPRNDPANCGGCGLSCPVRPLGSTCIDAECRCPGRQAACGSACTDLQTDPSNCGACGVVCADNQICADGLCRVDCPDDFVVCGEECRNLRTDPDNCGACGAACARLEVCNNGRCDTSCGNLTSCNGICRDLAHDPGHCGSCGNACDSGEVCVDGECSLVCGPGITNCDGVCRDLRVDPQNCGACGNRCSSRQICANGMCATISSDSYTLGPSPLMFVNACTQPGATVFLQAVNGQGIDDAFGTFMLPFTFRFYGAQVRTTWVSSNGVIGFGNPSIEYGNQCSLTGSVSNAVLAFWDDLITRASGVCVATVGSAPNRQFIATWNDVALLALESTTHLTFSVVLSETTDTVDVLYASAFVTPETQGTSASIGLASATAFALECCNMACLSNNSGKRYTPR